MWRRPDCWITFKLPSLPLPAASSIYPVLKPHWTISGSQWACYHLLREYLEMCCIDFGCQSMEDSTGIYGWELERLNNLYSIELSHSMECSIETHWTSSQEGNFKKITLLTYNSYTIYIIHPFEVYNSVDFSKGLAFLYLHISAQLLPMIFLTIISFPLLSTWICKTNSKNSSLNDIFDAFSGYPKRLCFRKAGTGKLFL